MAVQLKNMLGDAGFVDAKVTASKMPWGPRVKGKRMKELGLIANSVTETRFEAHGLALMTQVGGMPVEEAKKIAQEAHAEVCGKSAKVHTYNHGEWGILSGGEEDINFVKVGIS